MMAVLLSLASLADMALAQSRMMNVTPAVSVPSPRPLPLRGTEVPGGEGGNVSLATSTLTVVAEENLPLAVEENLLTVFAPNRSMDQVTAALIDSINANNYSFVRQQAIDSRLVPTAWEAKSVRIIYFCNFAMMNRALALDPRSAEMLPCRVTLLETAQGIEMIAVNPAWVSQRLANPVLHQDCLKLKQDFMMIMQEASQ
jgi:uncharacterized protein (DUF302 family)